MEIYVIGTKKSMKHVYPVKATLLVPDFVPPYGTCLLATLYKKQCSHVFVFLLNVNVITNKFAYNLYGLKNPYLLNINIVVE